MWQKGSNAGGANFRWQERDLKCQALEYLMEHASTDTVNYTVDYEYSTDEDERKREKALAKASVMAAICTESPTEWLRNCSNFLPDTLWMPSLWRWVYDCNLCRGTQRYNTSDKTKETVGKFMDWFDAYRAQIEMQLTERYLSNDDRNDASLKVLERRYRQHWEESHKQNIKADVNANATVDGKIDISFEVVK